MRGDGGKKKKVPKKCGEKTGSRRPDDDATKKGAANKEKNTGLTKGGAKLPVV